MADQRMTFTIGANMDISGILGAVKQMQGAFNNLKMPASLTSDILKDFDKLRESLSKFKALSEKESFSKTDIKNLNKLQTEIDQLFGHISSSFDELSRKKLYLDADWSKIQAVEQEIDGLKAKIQSKLSEIKIDFSGTNGKSATLGLDELVGGFDKAVKSSKVLTNAMAEVKQSLQMGDIGNASAQLEQIVNKATELKGAGTGLLTIFKQWGLIDLSKPASELAKTKEGAKLLQEGFAKLLPNISDDSKAVQDFAKQLIDLTQKKAELEKQGQSNYANKMREGADAARDLGSASKEATSSMVGMAEASKRTTDEVKQLQQTTQYFFSLRNMINLLRRGLRSAVRTVKELDAAMTKTAVVTKFSVGDMWAKLPEYTANANALGATVKDMYEATTLYYQQGLNTQQAMGIATETMKMARIGGLEAAEATDMMTAALRGFNMELSEVSAERINDVYSNLAAKTASNTEELGTAMQRTASIAASAGMSFEGTAAFLAQAIETTREPAENLGTAMKTIVARFTELKKNPLEITEVDGEEVSYNKVDTALQSIGVSLKDANGQFRDLDKVFLDISRKWDSLTQTQQRYIATTAAGSRQQSRFIAMMSNYERTMQLMDYANNASGASTEQFGKTLESLEAKINRLQNAWKEFLMNIMNDKFTKFAVDTGTKILNIVNKIIDLLSLNGKSGLLKTVLSLGVAFTALRGAGRLINGLIGGVGGFLDPTTKKGALSTTTKGKTGIASQITTPIIGKLNELIAAVKGQKTLDKSTTSTVAGYNAAVASLRSPKNTMGAIQATFNNLSDDHAFAAFVNSPGTAAAMKKATLQWFNAKNLGPELQKTGGQLISQIYTGMQKRQLPVKKGAELVGRPELWGKYLGTETAKEFSKQYKQAQQAQRITQAESARRQAWIQAGGSAFATEEGIKSYLKKNQGSDFAKEVANYYKQIRKQQQQQSSLPQADVDLKKYQMIANQVGMVGSRFTSAGYSIQMFGAQLSQLSPALAGVGNLISRFGILASTAGLAISGFGKTYEAVAGVVVAANEAMSVAKAQNAALDALTTGGAVAKSATQGASLGGAWLKGFANAIGPAKLIGIGATFAVGLYIAIKKFAEKKAKEAGEEVRKAYEEGFTKTDEKITSLEDKKGRFNELAKGVDEFGHNINLSNEEFDEYISLSRELKELSPSLIAGYNAEGEAIIKKGAAIDEVIKKLKEEKKEALETYTTNKSIDKLSKEFRTTDAYKNNRAYRIGSRTQGENWYSGQQTPFSTELSKIIKSEASSDVLSAINQLTGWNASALSSLSTEQLSFVTSHYSDLINLVKENNKELDEETEEGLKEAFGDMSSIVSDIMSEGQPIVEAMQQWMGLEGIDATGIGLGEEFGNSFNEGFNGIMLQGLTEGWSAEKFKSNLRDYSTEWKALAGDTSEYSQIMEEANNVTNEYLDTVGTDGAVEKYNEDIENSVEKLRELASQQDLTTASGQAFAQQCIQQANILENYTTESVNSLSEALNTATGEITAAEDALDSFDKATEKDYWTAAEGMKSIYDKAFETFKDSYGTEIEKHFEDNGDKTAWQAGEYILGQDAVSKLSDGTALKKALKKWEPALREGEEGWYNFWKTVTGDEGIQKRLEELKDEGVQLKDGFLSYIPEDQWANVAKALGISEEMLASMLNKGRQFANIDFTNWGLVRKTLETSETTLQGTTKQANGQNKLYVRKETFEQGLADAGYRPEEYTDKEETARKEQNVNLIDLNSSITKLKGQFEDMGLKTIPEFIKALIKTGDWTKDEIQQLAEKAGIEGYDKDTYSDLYDDIKTSIDNPELAKQTSELEGISNKLDTIIDNKTGKEAQQYAEDVADALTKGTKEVDTDAEAFAQGKKLIKDDKGNIISLTDLTEGEFMANKESYEQLAQVYEQDAARFYDRMIHSTGEEKEQYKAAWEQSVKNAETTRQFIKDATDNFNKHKEAEQAVKNEHDARAEAERKGIENTTFNNAPGENQNARENAIKQALQKQISQQISDNIYEGILKSSPPSAADLSKMGADDKINWAALWEAYADAPKEAFAKEAFSPEVFDNINTGIDNIGVFFNNLRNKILGIDTKIPTLKTDLPTNTGNSVTDAQNGRQNAINKSINANNSVTVDTKVENADKSTLELNEFEQTILEVQNVAAVGATFNIGVNASGLSEASKSTEAIAKAASGTQNIQVSAGTVDTSKVQTGIQSIAKMKAELPVKAKDDTAAGLRQIKRDISATHATMKVKVTSEGTTNFSVSVRKAEKGMNNFIPHVSAPLFGSLAKGTKSHHGQVGPRGKGGLTLTGEKGYEIAWLPSENRSMILGANGPQMLNLPSDAVVYTHEQSKKIIKQKSIPAGSHAESNISYDPSKSRYFTGGSSTKTLVKNAKKAGDKVSKTAEDTKKDVDRILVWWDNAARRAEAIQRRADTNQKIYEKYLKEIQSTLKTTGTVGKGNAYLNDMQKYITEQQRQLNKATNELKQLDSGKDTKGATVKATKANYQNGAANVVQISYDSGSGKKKKTKTAYINTANYIKYDEDSGAYQVDQSALNSVKNSSERKAIAEAVKKELDDYISKRNSAQDNIEKAQEELEKFGEELYETFFKWETELTKIWNITQKIEATEARISRAKGYSELLTSQLSTGLEKAGKDFAESTLKAFKIGIDNRRKQIEQTLESVGEKRNNLSRLLSLDDEKTTLDNIQKKLSDDVRADYNIQKAEAAEAKAKAALDKAQTITKTTTTPNKNISKISRTLQKGSKGSDVKDLQKALNQTLGTNLAIDGKFGSKTQAAVKKFQKKYGLSQTGKMDKKTLAKLADVTGTKKTTTVTGDPEVIAKAQEAYDKAVEYTKSVKEGNLNETEKLGYETYAEALEKGINAQARAWEFLEVQRRGDGTIDLNFKTEAFEEAKQNGEISEELGKSIQDYVKELVDSSKDLNEEYEKVTSLMNDLYGELETLQDQWVGYANDLWDMSEAETKKEIDNAKKLNDSLTKALKDLLDDVKKKLDQRRQQEDNAKTERDILQKQQRLAALRADTSGGHQVEIAQLEKEIAEAQQNYQRTLEDQLLEKLQQQADIAEQQRERQIELQETIAEAVNNAALVDMWMADPATFEQEIWEAYKAQNDYDKKPQALQENLLNKFNVMFDGLLNNQAEQEYVEQQIKELQEQKDILDTIKENVETLAADASIESVSGGEGVQEGGTQELLAQVLNKLIEDDKPTTTTTTTTSAATATPAAKKTTNNLKYGKVSAVSGTLKKGSSGNGVKALQEALNKILGTKLAVDGKFGSKTFAAVKKFQKKYGLSQDGVVGSKTKAKFKALGYSTGGLADYTGPAWLDGTPSKPELVLSPTDTKNFLALRDVLSGAMKSADSINSSYGGDATYEININVDHLNSDYDVDKVAERVKKIIIKDSSYRNVTQVRNFR